MDFWAENQGHMTPYNKYNTVPSRSCSQNYHDRQLAPQFPVYYEEQQHKAINSGYWPSRDAPSWANQETTNMASSQNFPFSFGHPIQRHYSDVGQQQRQEARDWATYLQQQERGLQREGWSYNPAHCKRDLSKRNESNFRELEAWALRYSHSLPRRRRIEAELRGARQDHAERRDMQMLNKQDSTQWERASRQQAPNYCQTAGPSFDAKLSYQTKLYSHPPNYNSPPPYCVQFRSVSVPPKFENKTRLQQVLKQQGRELFEKCSAKEDAQDSRDANANRQFEPGRPGHEAAKVIEGRKFKLNKKAGGMTIFCLVSRIADTERECSPISQMQSDDVQPKSSETTQPLKLADEVDFKIQTPMKHARSPYSKLQAIPICHESLCKMAEKSGPKTNEVSAYEKLAAQSKYPLWRRPSFTSNTESENAAVNSSKDTLDSNLRDNSDNPKARLKIDKESVREDKDGAMLRVDATCVVVKLEVLQGPKKEQVHYLGSENQLLLCPHDNSANKSNSENAEDFKTLPEREAKGNEGTEKDKCEDIVIASSQSARETLEERAKRICGLHESTMTQIPEKIFDLGVEESSMETECVLKSELQNVATISTTETIQEVEICKDNVTDEFDASKESEKDLETDRGLQKSKTAEHLELEMNGGEALSGQCAAPTDPDQSTDVSNILAVSKEERDNDIFPVHYESPLHVNVQYQEHLDKEFDETQLVCEETTVQSTIIEENIEILPDDFLDCKDKNEDTMEKDCDGNVDEQKLVEKLANMKQKELSNPEPEPGQTEELFCSNSANDECEEVHEARVQASEIKTLQQLDSGQLEDIPALEIELQGEQYQEEQQPQEANDEKAGVENSGKDMEVAISDFEIQGKAEKGIEACVLTCGKEQSEPREQGQADVLLASKFKDFQQETQLESSDNLKEHCQFGCQEITLKKEQGLDNKDIVEKRLQSCIAHENQGNEQPHVIDPRVEPPSEEVFQSQDIKVINLREGPTDSVSCLDMSTSYPEICKEIMQNNTECGQDDQCCTQHAKTLEESVENSDILQKMHKDEEFEVIESIQEKKMRDSTCEGVAVLVAKYEQAKDIESQRNMKQILVETGTTATSDCEVKESNLQQCEWEDSPSKSCLNDEDLIQENENSHQSIYICQSGNKDKEVGETRLVSVSDPYERSTDYAQQCIPSTSMCDNDFEDATCEEEGKYPKSLRDAVNRIRKHTAPDSENEEEEVMDSWDRESLADTIVSFENVFEKGFVDLIGGMRADQYEDLTMEDDVCSQCSNCSQESDGTIVDDDVLVELTNIETMAICKENQGSDEEEKCETQNEGTVNTTLQIEEDRLDEDAETPDEIML